MRRISILGLMGLVLAFAVAFAALRHASDEWAGVVIAALLGLLGTSILGVVYRRGRTRAGWLGFLVFAGGYALLAFGPGLNESLGVWLPTNVWLERAHEQAVGPIGPYLVAANSAAILPPLASPPLGDPAGVGPVPLRSLAKGYMQATATPRTPKSALLRSMLPGALNRQPFVRVGHGLFGLLAGVFGAILAARMQAGAERREAGDAT